MLSSGNKENTARLGPCQNLTGAAFEHVSDANTFASEVELESAAGKPASANKMSRLVTRRTSRGVGRILPAEIYSNRTSPIIDACSTNGTGSLFPKDLTNVDFWERLPFGRL